MTVISGVEEHSQHIGRVYQENYARLHSYFKAQLGDTLEAEGCVQETVRRLFVFMEDRSWEEDAEYVPVYLMRIAGALLCANRVAAGTVGGERAVSLSGKIKNELIQPFTARLEFVRLFMRQQGMRRAPSLKRATATTT